MFILWHHAKNLSDTPIFSVFMSQPVKACKALWSHQKDILDIVVLHICGARTCVKEK